MTDHDANATPKTGNSADELAASGQDHTNVAEEIMAKHLTARHGGSMRRWAAVAVAAGMIAAATFAVTSADGRSGRDALRVFEHDTTQASIDLGATGESPGDKFLFAGDVFDHKGGTKLGRAAGTCTTMSTGAGGEVLCVVQFALRRGQIAGQGLFVASELFAGKTLDFPITGGSGAYRHARGSGSVQIPADVPDQTDANFTLGLGPGR